MAAENDQQWGETIGPSQAKQIRADSPGILPRQEVKVDLEEQSNRSAGPHEASARSRPLPKHLGHYQNIEPLGQGGKGTVYLAFDTSLERKVVLKFPKLGADGETLKRFEREAKALAKLNHPNICHVYAHNIHDGEPYFAMEYVTGGSLADDLSTSGVKPQREAAALVRKLARAMREAHESGVSHRDLKLLNVMLKPTREGPEPVIIDFGLARRDGLGEKTLSLTSVGMGMDPSMPLERFNGDHAAIGPACDVSALGVILYELLTGQRLLQDEQGAMISRKSTSPTPPPSAFRPEIDPRLDAICQKAMAVKIEDRYASMSALTDALDDFLTEKPKPDSEPAPQRKPAPKPPSRRPSRRRMLALATSAIVVLGLITVATNKGLVKVELPDPANGGQAKFTNSLDLTMVRIPFGTFMMGSPDSDKDARASEKPRHEVRITRAFYLGVTEVTQGQYRAVTGDKPSYFKGSDDLPVESVSWYDAVKFCNALSVKEGLAPFYLVDGKKVEVLDWRAPGYRLPTEAEWEYACRARSTTNYWFGDDPAELAQHSWFNGNSEFKTHSVSATGHDNPFGLFDMLGNVYEWCWDENDVGYYNQSPGDDPSGPHLAAGRVSRGGCWCSSARSVRSADRGRGTPEDRSSYLGFRVARVPSDR